MKLELLRRTLINFVGKPNESWGEPTDGHGNPSDINTGKQARVNVEQSDRNTARINSGTYTKEQYDDFYRQLDGVERHGRGTAYFSGDPDNLPESLPERECPQCEKAFRSAKADWKAKCYSCCLEELCPALPGKHITAYWRRDEWRMEAHGDIGFRNEMTFEWYNSNSHGNTCHQGVVVHRNADGAIRKLVFSTVASRSRRCYTVTFDREANSVKFARADNVSNIRTSDVADNNYAKFVAMEELDDLVLDLMEAKLPSWMLYKHRPRNPANGCFAA